MGRRQDAAAKPKAAAGTGGNARASAPAADHGSSSTGTGEPTAALLRAARRERIARNSSSACRLYKTLVLTVAVPAIAIAVYTYVFASGGSSFGAATTETLAAGSYAQTCPAPDKSLSAAERKRFHACGILGVTRCGRAVVDDFLSADEVAALLSLATTGMSVTSGGSGGPTVLDMASGAVSKGDKFVDVYKTMAAADVHFNRSHVALYRDVTDRVRSRIAQHFTANEGDATNAAAALTAKLHLTKPSFFTRITPAPAVTPHDEYWHSHVDRLQYGTFAVTALVYLNSYGVDYTGGRFVFQNSDGSSVPEPGSGSESYVEPRAGRLSFFTSGHENPHYVERVVSGTRYALTIAFSCDPKERVTPKAYALLDD